MIVVLDIVEVGVGVGVGVGVAVSRTSVDDTVEDWAEDSGVATSLELTHGAIRH